MVKQGNRKVKVKALSPVSKKRPLIAAANTNTNTNTNCSSSWHPVQRADPFCAEARKWIAAIPRGKVATYGQVAHLAGKPWGARQVAWILHSQAERYGLPWQRVIGASGRISLPPGGGFAEQGRLLRREGVAVGDNGAVDLERFQWRSEGRFPGRKTRHMDIKTNKQ